MSTATIEPEVDKTLEQEQKDLRQKEEMAFKMPKPCRGQAIEWFPHATRTNGEVAFVLDVGARNILISRASGTCVESVRHIDDPKLKRGVEQRESGAWDFTESDKDIVKLKQDVAELKALFNEPAKKGK